MEYIDNNRIYRYYKTGEETMTVLIIKIATSVIVGFFAGPAAVYVFNHMPAGWLTEYGENPQKDPRLAKGEKRIKENPWRWVYAAGFICLCLRLSLIEYSDGMLSVAPELTTETTQIAVAGLVACWILLIIALADLKFMIIPDQFVLLLALTAIGFAPLWRDSGMADAAAQTGGLWESLNGFWQPLIGMVIGGGFIGAGAGDQRDDRDRCGGSRHQRVCRSRGTCLRQVPQGGQETIRTVSVRMRDGLYSYRASAGSVVQRRCVRRTLTRADT